LQILFWREIAICGYVAFLFLFFSLFYFANAIDLRQLCLSYLVVQMAFL